MTIFVLLLTFAGVDVPCSLQEAINRARDSATQSQTAKARSELEVWNRKEILSQLLPKVVFSGLQMSQSSNLATFGLSLPNLDPYVPFFSVQDIRISGAVPLINLALWSRLRETNSTLAAREQEHETVREASALQGGLAWIEAARASALEKDRHEGWMLAQKLREMAQDQKQVGTATRLDMVRAQIQETQSERAWSVARLALDKALLALARILGLQENEQVVLVGDLPLVPQEALPAPLQDERPEVLAARAQRLAAQEGVRTANADKLPTISAFADYGFTGTHLERDGLWTGKVGVVANWNLFEGGGRKARLEQARLRAHLAALNERETSLEAGQEKAEAFATLTETAEQLKQAMWASALADTELVLAQDKFRAGASGNTEVILAQGSRTQAHAAWIDAAGAHQAALLKLRWVFGNWR